MEGIGNASTARELSALKAFLAFAREKAGMVESDPVRLRGPRLKKGLPRPITPDDAVNLAEMVGEAAAESWIGARDRKRPWMMHLAHKAVHSEFIPAPRHAGRYADARFRYPDNMKPGMPGRPMWVENQRNSWHGVDFPYLLTMIHDSFMSRPNIMVVPGGKMELAMQLVLTPIILDLMEKKWKRSSK